MARPFARQLLGWVKGAAAIAGSGVVFAAASLGGLALYADFPAGRRAFARIAERALDQTFVGEFAIAALDEVSLGHVVARGITIHDEKGHLVLSASSLSVHVDSWQLLRKLLLDSGDVTLNFGAVRIERAETYVAFEPGSDIPTIARAFTPRPAASPPASGATVAREVRVWLPQIEVGHIYTRATLPGLPTLEGEFSAVHGSVLGAASGTAVDVERFAAIVRGIGGTEAHGVGGVHVRAPGAVWTSFDGYLGELQLGAVVRVDGSKLSISADAPRARAQDVRALWAAYPLLQDVTAHVDASGTPSKLVTVARLAIGEHGALETSGTVALGGALGAELEATGRNLDLRALWPKAPETWLDADAHVALEHAGNELSVAIDGSSKQSEIGGITVPAFDLDGRYQQQTFTGHASVHERGIPVRANLTIHPDGAIDVDARSERVDLRKAPRLKPYFDGRGSANMRVTAHVAKNRVDAELVADVSNFEYGSLKLARGAVTGSVAGPLDAPEQAQLDMALDAKDLQAGSFAFERARAKLRGPARAPTISAALTSTLGPTVNAKATLAAARPSLLRDLALELKRDDAAISGKVEELDLEQGTLRVSGLKLQGASGALQGSLSLSPEALRVDALGSDLDLDQIARVLGLPHGALGGKVALEAHVDTGKRSQTSSLNVSLSKASIQHVAIDALSLNATLDHGALNGRGSAQVQGVGEFASDFALELDGPLPSAATWRKATGSVTTRVIRVPLTLLAFVLPKSARVASLGGEAQVSASVSRADANAPPSATLDVVTSGLSVNLTSEQASTPGASINGLDAVLGARADGPSGACEVTLKLQDTHGALASATTTFEVDVARALREPRGLWARLQSTPVLGKLTVEDRALDELPALIAPSEVSGRLRADATLGGTLQDPTLSAKAELRTLRFGDSEHALDVCGAFDYDKTRGTFNARGELFQPAAGARACLGTRLARASLGGSAPWQKLRGGGSGGEPAWTASGGVSFEGLPVETVTALSDAGLRGRLFGAVMFEREAALPLVSAQLEMRDTTLDRVTIGTARLGVRSDGRTLASTVRIEQAHGSLEGALRGALDWNGAVPALDPAAPITASVQARSADAVLLAPFLQDVLSEISGKLDADLTARFTHDASGLNGAVTGKLSMRRGTMKLARLALPLSNVEFSARAEQQGAANLITIDSLSASADADKPNLSASAKLLLNGFRVSKGNANVSLQDVPLLIEGQTLATLTGRNTAIALERRPQEMWVTLQIPELEAKLPEEASRQLIELKDSPDISIEQPIAEPRRGSDPSALPWRLRFDLGNDVRMSRGQLLIPVAGSPEIRLDDEVTVLGTVELRPGGHLLLPGLPHTFTLESGGEVTFEGENDNPRLAFTAGTYVSQLRIRAVVRGTFKQPDVHLESDPARGESEIYAILLGASSNDSSGTSTSGDKALGTNVSNYFGQQLGQKVLGNTALSNLELKTGNETTVDQRSYSTYTAAYPISENLWFEGSYKTLQNADPTEPNANAFSGTFDWRFRRNWSLRTELGNIGAGLDLLWSYRY